jgi:hypothetical protein
LSQLVKRLEATMQSATNSSNFPLFPLPLQQASQASSAARPIMAGAGDTVSCAQHDDVEDVLLALSTCLKQCAAGSGLAALSEVSCW